jgi:hypothetical protein
MIAKQAHNELPCIEEFSLPESYTIHRILIFIKTQLAEFEIIYNNSEIVILKEDDISKELSRFFNDRARQQNLYFQFNEKKGVDFTIFISPFVLGLRPIFMVEAKRLSKSHYDYVSGPTGGIERFKREQDEFGKHLNLGAMIGYIQEENHEYWIQKVNDRIESLINKESDILWTREDKLVRSVAISDFTSKHMRISQCSIALFHFWISLNQI